MKKVIDLYAKVYGKNALDHFYGEVNNHTPFLNGEYDFSYPEIKNRIKAPQKSIKVDLPIWYGDINKSKVRIMVLGKQPGNTTRFNIGSYDYKGVKYITGAAFGLDSLTPKQGSRTNNNYKTAFADLLSLSKKVNHFVYFTDVVKELDVPENTVISEKDLYRKKIIERDCADFLIKEIEIISPTHIIALGDDAHNFIWPFAIGKKQFPEYIGKACHPSYLHHVRSFEEIQQLLKDWKILI